MDELTQYPRRSDGPFRNVIVGSDERQGGRDAAALAADLVATDGSLTQVTVDVRDLLVGRSSATDLQAIARASGVEPTALAQDAAGQLVRIGATSVGRGLHEFAESAQADLLVIGSSRRGLLGRVLIGDDTNEAFNVAPCAVAIAPRGYAGAPQPLSEIGVAYNGSPESTSALTVARALAALHGARVSAFEAVRVPVSVEMPELGAVAQALPGLIDQSRARITALGDVEAHAAYGVPAEELALYSASLDLLVVGSRGYGPFGRFVHGSTSRQLGRTARCPLLLLTRSAPIPSQSELDRSVGDLAVAARG